MAQFPWTPSIPMMSQTGALISLAPSQSNPIPSPPMEYMVPHLPTPILTNTTTPVENNRDLDGPNRVRTTTPRRTRRHYEAENSDEDYYPPLQTRARARTVDRAIRASAVPYDEHSKVKIFLSKYAPLMKWQRYPDARPVGQPKYETEHYHHYNREYHINELETLISRYFIEIKDSLTLALECESKAAFHHFNVGMKLVILQERLENDVPTLTRALREGLGMSLRYFRLLL